MSDFAIAIDIGGSHAEYGIVSQDQAVAAETIQVADASLQTVLLRLEKAIPALATRCGVEMRMMAGIAVGICATVDCVGVVRATNGKYDDGVGFHFGQWSKGRFGLSGRAENDARLALLGEHSVGAAKGFDDAVLVTLGTGIGGAAMLGGQLLRSRGQKAGGLAGHLGVSWNGRLCSCGNLGCAEAEASTASLNAICRENPSFAGSALAKVVGKINFKNLFEVADAGDTLACEVLDRCISVWSALTISLIHAYDPQVIVFGGGLMQRQQAILPKIREHVDRHAWTEKGSVKIVPTALGSSAALLGALPLLRGRS